MSTFIYSKQAFIDYLQKEVKDDQAVIFSMNLTGNLTCSKKNGLRMTHVFSEEVFKDEGVGHIALGKSHPLCLIIADKERLSNAATKVLNNDKNVQVSDTTEAK